MVTFDPDAYLSQAQGFDPDAYLKAPAAAPPVPPSTFDPDSYLKQPTSPVSPIDFPIEVGKGVLKGLTGAAVTSPLQGIAGQIYEPDTSKPIPAPPPGGYKSEAEVPELPVLPVAQSTPYKAAQYIEDLLPKDTDIFPKIGGKDVIRDVSQGVGSVVGNIATMFVPGYRAIAPVSILAQGAGEATERAVKANATEDQIRRAASLGNIAGATEFADALLVNMGSWGKAAGLAQRVGLNTLKGFFIEGGQEGLQQGIQNAIAKGVYKPDQSIMEDVGYNFIIGGIVGGSFGAATTRREAPVTAPTQDMINASVAPVEAPAPQMPNVGAPPITTPEAVPPVVSQIAPTSPTLEEVKAQTLSPQIVDFVNKEAELQVPTDPSQLSFDSMIEPQMNEVPERVTLPAVRIDGQVFTGAFHPDAFTAAAKKLGVTEEALAARIGKESSTFQGDPAFVDKTSTKNSVDGFVTDRGRYVSREEAYRIAKRSGQIERGMETPGSLSADSLTPQMSQVQTTPGANTARLAKLLGPKLYGEPSNIAPVSVKEMFQNAFDAVKASLERKGIDEGKIDITMDRTSRTIGVTDNGSGMTPEVLANQFLQIAGTHKESKRASGGLGIAKMLFIFGNKGLHVTTMRNGKVSELNTTGEELFSALDDVKKAPQITVRTPTSDDLRLFPRGQGTHVEVTVPQQYHDSTTGEEKRIEFPDWVDQHEVLSSSPLFDNIGVTFNGNPVNIGKEFPLEDFTQFANVKFPWGTARIYVSQRPVPKGYSSNAHVLSNGLWQFSAEVKQDPTKPYGKNIDREIYIDLNSQASPEEPGYPFDLNRQQFAPSTKKAFENLFRYMSLLYRQIDIQKSVANFGSMQFLDYDAPNKSVTASSTVKIEPKAPPPPNAAQLIKPGDKVSVVNGQLVVNGRQIPELTPEEIEKFKINPDALRVPQSEIDPRRVILHDNTDITVSESETRSITEYGRERFGKRFDQYAFALGNAFKELRDVVVRYMPKQGYKGPVGEQTKPKDPFEQVPFGVKDVNGYEDLKHEGIGVSFDRKYYGVSIRVPFAAMFLNVAIADRTDPLGAAVDMTFTMVHELAHHVVRNHDAEFMNEVQRIIVMLDTNPNFNFHAFKQKMVNILTAYHDVYTHLRAVYTSGDFKVTNRGQRFQDANASEVIQPSLSSIQNAGTDEAGNGQPSGNNAAPRGEPESGSQLSDWHSASETVPTSQSGRADPTLALGPSRSNRPSDNGRARNYAALSAIDPGITAPPQQPEVNVLRNTIRNSPVGNGSVPPVLKEATAHADRFNWMYKYMAGISQLLDGNPYFQPLRRYVERARQMHSDESTIWDAAMQLQKKHWRPLGKQRANLQALILDIQTMPYLTPAERKLEAWRHPTPAEMAALVTKHKVSNEALDVYNRMRRMDETFMRLQEESLKASAARRIQDPVRLAARIDEIEAYGRMARAQPFFPFTHFGRYYVIVKDAAGSVTHFETFEPRRLVGITTKRAEAYQQAQVRALQRQAPPGHVVEAGVLPETAEPFIGQNPLMLQELLDNNVGLTDQQIAAIKLIQSIRNPAMALKHRAMLGENTITGHSLDLPRSFAKYYFHGGRYYAKLQHLWALKIHVNEARLAPGNKAGLIASYMNDHLENNVLDARGDFGFWKGAIFLWAMGYSVAAATTNLTQTPFVTYPFLAGKFGDIRATKHIVKSMLDVTNFYRRGFYTEPSSTTSLSFEMKALGYGIKTGRISETQAAEIAGLAGGGKLISGMGGSPTEQAAAKFQEKAAWAFETAEQFNRRVVFRAALRLAQENPKAKFVNESIQKYQSEFELLKKGSKTQEPFTEAEARAIVTAIHATDQTQFVYSKHERSVLFRGKKNIFFVFKQYLSSLLWMLGSNKSDVLPRWLIITMLMGGLGGVPGYEELKGLLRAIGYWYFGKDVNLDKLIRDWGLQWFNGTVPPDVVLHGLSRRGFGIPAIADMMGGKFPVLDRSRAIGVGNILPVNIGNLAVPGDKVDKVLADEAQRASGAVFSVGFNMYKAIMDRDSPGTDVKRWEKAMPRAFASASRSYRAFSEGRERGGKGGPNSAATIVPYDVRDTEQLMEVLALGLGYQPLRQQAKWDIIMAQAESKAFYDLRKKDLLEEWHEAIKGKDPKEIEAVRAATIKYNNELPDFAKAKALSTDTIRKSMQTRERVVVSREIGVPIQKSDIGISREMQRLFPEATIDVRRVR